MRQFFFIFKIYDIYAVSKKMIWNIITQIYPVKREFIPFFITDTLSLTHTHTHTHLLTKSLTPTHIVSSGGRYPNRSVS